MNISRSNYRRLRYDYIWGNFSGVSWIWCSGLFHQHGHMIYWGLTGEFLEYFGPNFSSRGFASSSSRVRNCNYPGSCGWRLLFYWLNPRRSSGIHLSCHLSNRSGPAESWKSFTTIKSWWFCWQDSYWTIFFRCIRVWGWRRSSGRLVLLAPSFRRERSHDERIWHFDISSRFWWVWRWFWFICWWWPCPIRSLYLWSLNIELITLKQGVQMVLFFNRCYLSHHGTSSFLFNIHLFHF